MGPKRPPPPATRGYTEELWKMLESCWNQNPNERPTVDSVLKVLTIAAERWEPGYGAPVGSSNSTDAQSASSTNSMRVQSQNLPDTLLTPDNIADLILTKTKLPFTEGGVRVVVEALEKVSRKYFQPTDRRIQPSNNSCWSPDIP